MRILVTGGAGFIGSNFVHFLLEETDHRVTTLDALTYAGSKSNLEGALADPSHELVVGDIRDGDLVGELMERMDWVVNFAAESHVDRSIESAEPFVSTNVEGTMSLLEAARDADVDRFVQISTDEVYGEIETGEFVESDALNPRNPYAATKAGADLLALSYQTTHDVPVIITRSSNNYGPRQHHEKLIPKLITRAANEEALPLYGDGSHVREWTYVEDNCRAIDLVLREGRVGEVYNVGSGIERSNNEVAQQIIDALDARGDLIEYVDDRPGHDRRYAMNTEKIQHLGWRPGWSFADGIEATMDYYL